jgi:hypothetical protein
MVVLIYPLAGNVNAPELIDPAFGQRLTARATHAPNCDCIAFAGLFRQSPESLNRGLATFLGQNR